MNTNPNAKRTSYTLFSVTQEDRKSRSQRIRDYFRLQPALAYLMAAFDFEWTVRRAILLLSKCPIPVIKTTFDIKRYAGWNDYQGAWTCCVLKTRDDIHQTLGRVIFGGTSESDISKEERASLQQAMNFRNRLVHGIAGSIPADKTDEAFELLLTSSERIAAYVDGHSKRGMFQIASRPMVGCKKCPKWRRCKFQQEKKAAEERAKVRKAQEGSR